MSAAKQIFSITPFSMLDYPGNLSCIVWFARCNMKCGYCYNPEIVYGNGVFDYTEVIDFLKKRVGLLDGVVLSGGECTVRKDLIPFVEEIKSLGFKIKVDTNGSRPDVIQYLIQKKLIDYVALDFKAMDTDYYRITKNTRFDLFEYSLDLLLNLKFEFEVRTTVHSKLLPLHKIENMIQYLELKGYNREYYLQPFRNNVETIGELPNSYLNDEYKNVNSNYFKVVWR